MPKTLNILLIEDDPHDCQEIINYIEKTHFVELVNVTNNTIKAIEFIKESPPDAIILDLELHKGHGNGLTFLESLNEMKLADSIYVLVTTNNTSYLTHESVREMGADFIMIKSQEDYSAKTVVDFLCSLRNIIHRDKKEKTYPDDNEPPRQKEQKMAGRVMADLDFVGIPPHAVGRKYLIDGIILIVNGQTEKIYTTISMKYGKTESSVERAMQIAIEKAWKTAPIKDLEKYYTARIYSSKGVPTIMEFIHHYAEKIKNEL
jgi:DNA-binding NarL/FixJ family response regulator